MPFLRLFVVLLALAAVPASADPIREWMQAWPRTDFGRSAVPLDEIRSSGPGRDGLPSIDSPEFATVAEAGVPAIEPVVSVEIAGDARAYPLRVLIWHQIVNDEVGGTPVAVTYCPLTNTAIVFDRRVGGDTLQFGTTGLLRYSGLIMYDRHSESWWQQYGGRAIVGDMAGARLQPMSSRLEAMQRFSERFPAGRVLVPADANSWPYGRNPYTGYDSMPSPYYYEGPLPEELPALARVVSVGERAWSLALIRARRRVEAGDLVIEWTPGQSSALDAKRVAGGRDVGNVVVRKHSDGIMTDVPYAVGFAFAFKAFHPHEEIVVD